MTETTGGRTVDDDVALRVLVYSHDAATRSRGLAKQLRDELDRCPPVLVLIGRADDRWLADWSRADASVPHPIDPLRLRDAVNGLLAPA